VPRIASVCSGTFFLAAAGALDGRRATTHWSEIDALKRFCPAVLVEGDAIHIEDRGIWTSSGVTAGMDLALAMIEADLGRKVALAIAAACRLSYSTGWPKPILRRVDGAVRR
jgi:transcriptional regulator GlxA family with amidase domain